jgi:sugar lactone lactonase YvrE
MRWLGIFLIFLCAPAMQAQSLSGPESIEFDAPRNRYLISNRSAGEILARSSTGALSVFSADPNSPAGLDIVGNTLFVADGARVRGYDLDTAQIVMTLTISGASFLNGLGSNGVDRLWTTDFTNNRLHEINIANLSSPVLTTLIQTTPNKPNGVLWDGRNNRLLVLSWGSNAAIYAYRFSDANYAPLITTNFANFDGLAFDCDGNLYFSSWTPAAAIKFVPYPISSLSAVSDFPMAGLASPADITYNRIANEIAVPNSGNSSLSFQAVNSCAGVMFRDRFE